MTLQTDCPVSIRVRTESESSKLQTGGQQSEKPSRSQTSCQVRDRAGVRFPRTQADQLKSLELVRVKINLVIHYVSMTR